MRRLAVLLAAILMVGRASAGIFGSDDPNAILSEAEDLRGVGRIMQARLSTEQAIALFAKAGDNAGLAKAYREYGLVALDGGLGDDPVVWRERSATRHPRPQDLDLAQAKLEYARDLGAETKQLFLVANIDFVLGNIQVMRGVPQQSCPYYDTAIREFRDAMHRQPGPVANMPQGVTDPAAYIGRAKAEAGCAP